MLDATELADYLNRLFESDPEAVTKLVEYRVPFESSDSQVVVRASDGKAGLMGILNGLCSDGPVAAVYGGPEAKLQGFSRAWTF